jgi:hypothetical protein
MAQYAQKGGQVLEGAEEVVELVRLIGMGQQAWESLGPWVEAVEKEAEKEAERWAQEAEVAKERERTEVEAAATRAAAEEVRQAQEKARAAVEEVEWAQRRQVTVTGAAREVADVFRMLFFIFGIDQDVVEVHYHEFIDHIREDVVHKMLECCRDVG